MTCSPRSSTLHYQPVYDLRTDQIAGAEALLRWDHSELGWLNPELVVELAELSGLIQPLARFVAREALTTTKQWLDRGHELRMAINLSARNLYDRNLVVWLQDTLRSMQLPAHLLKCELTESQVMDDPVLAMDVISKLKEIGVHTAIDDFGTGYSSLSYLRRLPGRRDQDRQVVRAHHARRPARPDHRAHRHRPRPQPRHGRCSPRASRTSRRSRCCESSAVTGSRATSSAVRCRSTTSTDLLEPRVGRRRQLTRAAAWSVARRPSVRFRAMTAPDLQAAAAAIDAARTVLAAATGSPRRARRPRRQPGAGLRPRARHRRRRDVGDAARLRGEGRHRRPHRLRVRGRRGRRPGRQALRPRGRVGRRARRARRRPRLRRHLPLGRVPPVDRRRRAPPPRRRLRAGAGHVPPLRRRADQAPCRARAPHQRRRPRRGHRRSGRARARSGCRSPRSTAASPPAASPTTSAWSSPPRSCHAARSASAVRSSPVPRS